VHGCPAPAGLLVVKSTRSDCRTLPVSIAENGKAALAAASRMPPKVRTGM
jgi:hypothetical protein